MAEALLTFPDPILDDHGHAYVGRVCGRQGADGRWEGWIEFVPGDGGPVIRTERETTQTERSDLQYWASGLTSTYMEGALERVLHPGPHPVPSSPSRPAPSYEGPAPASAATATGAAIETPRAPPYPHAVLDPLGVFAQGEAVLRQQLGALGTVTCTPSCASTRWSESTRWISMKCSTPLSWTSSWQRSARGRLSTGLVRGHIKGDAVAYPERFPLRWT